MDQKLPARGCPPDLQRGVAAKGSTQHEIMAYGKLLDETRASLDLPGIPCQLL